MRNNLLPGDILLYRKDESVPWYKSLTLMGTYISWGEWNGGRGNYDYVHAGIVLDPSADRGFEQNPPATHYTELSKENWALIDVYRLNPEYKIDVEKLTEWCASDLDVKYPFGKYFRLFGAAALARIGLISAAQSMDAGGTHSDKSWAVCSATVCMALSASTGAKLWPVLDEDMRPCDIPLGQVTKVIA